MRFSIRSIISFKTILNPITTPPKREETKKREPMVSKVNEVRDKEKEGMKPDRKARRPESR